MTPPPSTVPRKGPEFDASITDSLVELPALVPAPSYAEEKAGRELVQRSAFTLVTLAVVVFLLDFARDILVPLAVATFLNLILGPLVRRLHLWKVPRVLAAGGIMTIVVTCITALVVLSAPAIERLATQIPAALTELRNTVMSNDSIGKVLNATKEADVSASVVGEKLAVPVEITTSKTPEWLAAGTGTFAEIVLIIFMAFLMLSAGDRFRKRARRIFKGSPLSERILAATEQMESSVSTYMVTITLINTGLGIAVGCGMWLVGMEDPMVWGVVAAVLNFVPYLGPLITTALIGIASLSQFGGLSNIILPVGVYLALNSIEAFAVTPIVLGRRLQLSPVAALISVLCWTWLWGLGGAIIAVPFLVATYCVCTQIAPLRPLAMLIAH